MHTSCSQSAKRTKALHIQYTVYCVNHRTTERVNGFRLKALPLIAAAVVMAAHLSDLVKEWDERAIGEKVLELAPLFVIAAALGLDEELERVGRESPELASSLLALLPPDLGFTALVAPRLARSLIKGLIEPGESQSLSSLPKLIPLIFS